MFTHYFRFARGSALGRRRAPLLERLLARADSAAALSDWRADAFRLIAPGAASMPGVGAAALYSECGAVAGSSVMVATPVHYLAETSNVRMAADGILSLRQAEAEALAADFNRVWHDAGIRMLAARRAALFCIDDRPLSVSTREPEDVLAQHIENFLPAGADAPRLRLLMSEIEMWLFEHAVNRARDAAAEAVVSGLWLWGGGASLSSLPEVSGWTAGDDLFFNSFAARRDPAANASAVVATVAQPATDEWRQLESRWLEGSLEDLRAGRIGRLSLSAGDRCYSLSSRGSRRFWRRARPWWEYFA